MANISELSIIAYENKKLSNFEKNSKIDKMNNYVAF